MVAPFAVAVGVGMALGLLGAAMPWVLVIAAACAGLYMWNTRAPASTAADGQGAPKGGASLLIAVASYAGVFVLMGLVGGAGYLMGGFFAWARLDA